MNVLFVCTYIITCALCLGGQRGPEIRGTDSCEPPSPKEDFIFVVVFFICFETESHCITLAVLELIK